MQCLWYLKKVLPVKSAILKLARFPKIRYSLLIRIIKSIVVSGNAEMEKGVREWRR